ncbi:MAG: hypothetical protein IKS15_05330 [Opitutales bacterium]|nr:hypothetical protein [Opitutales bacterium]
MKKATPKMLSTTQYSILNLKMRYDWEEQITCYDSDGISQKNADMGTMTKNNNGIDSDPVDFEK